MSDLRRVAQETHGVLLLYFVGHGTVTATGDLVLAVTDTIADEADVTGLEYSKIRSILSGSPAKVKAVILDCCYSGRAIDILAGDGQFVADTTDIRGTYTLTAADHVAHAGRAGEYTAFTGELLDLISVGIAGGPPVLTFAELYPQLRRRLIASNLPHPNQRGTDTADKFPVTKNASGNADPSVAMVNLRAKDSAAPQSAAGKNQRPQGPELHRRIRRRALVLGSLAAFGAGGASVAVKFWPEDTKHILADTYTGLVAFSPDGRTLAGAVSDHGWLNIRLWDAATGHTIAATADLVDEYDITGLAFSPDGKILATSHDGGIRLRDPATGVPTNNLTNDKSEAIAFSRDGKILASSHPGKRSDDIGQIRLWSTVSNRLTATIPWPASHMGVGKLALSPDGKILAACSSSEVDAHGSWLWNVSTGRTTVTFFREATYDVAFRPDGKAIATSGQSGVRLWDMATKKILTTFSSARTTSVAFSADGAALVTGGSDGVRLWNAATGQKKTTLDNAPHPFLAVAVALRPDGKAVAGGGQGGCVLWNIS